MAHSESFNSHINWIPRTKLKPPRLSVDIIGRIRLHAQLEQALQKSQFILISSPAGSGKTTLAADFLANGQTPYGWLRLNQDENNLQTFITSLVAALQAVDSNIAQATLQLIEVANDSVAVLHRAINLFINDILDADTPIFTLVLDDYHAIENETIHSAVDYLLEQMPPNMRLMLTTRYDPPLALAKLRMRGQLKEIRLEHLRFAADETGQYLADQVGYQLSADQLQTLHLRTDGWIAGVRLLALTLGRISDGGERDTFINQFSQSNRLVFELLAEEVLAQQPAELRNFLLKTAILDELSPTLCAAVTENEHASTLLEDIYQRNLFITATDPYNSAETTYRYHDLFAGFLHKELQKHSDIDLAALHLRAAAASPLAEQKIHHLLSAQAWEAAIEQIITVGKEQASRGFIGQQVIDWIGQLPADSHAQYYWLDLIRGLHTIQRGIKAEASRLANRALAAARAQDDISAELAALRLLSFYGAGEESKRIAEIVEKHPDLIPISRRTGALMGMAWIALNKGSWENAQPYFYSFLEAAGMDRIQYGNIAAQHIGPQWLFVENGMGLIEQFDRETLATADDWLPQLGAYMRLGWISFLRGELKESEEFLQKGEVILHRFGPFAFTNLVFAWLRMNLLLCRSQYGQIEQIVESAENRPSMTSIQRSNLAYFWFARWRSLWLQEKIEEARKLNTKINQSVQPKTQETHPIISLMNGWEAFADGQKEQAEKHLLEAVQRHSRERWTGTWGNANIDLALFYYLRGDKKQALRTWQQAGAEMEQRGMPGQVLLTGRKVAPLLKFAVERNSFVDIAQMALSHFDTALRPLSIPESNEKLTPREVEVLHLLGEGASNRTIAERLTVTPRTAKAHVSNIMQKLQVASRSQAVARARELSLL